MKQIAVIALLLSVCASAQGAQREFDGVEFGPLHYMSKGEIALGGGIARNGAKIVIDKAKLESYLSKETMVRSYKLIDKNNVLTILVSEREPAFTVVLRGKNRTVICETDRSGRIISAGRSYRNDAPLIVAPVPDSQSQGLPPSVTGLIGVLNDVKKRALWRELGQITLLADGRCSVLLKNRPTVFTVGADDGQFSRLEALACQLDRSGRYPRTAVIRDMMAVTQNAE